MHRVWAIIERDLRRFRRSPALMLMSMFMPLVQLVVLGYAFGGKIQNLKVGVVDEDHGVPAIKLHEMFQAVAANAKTYVAQVGKILLTDPEHLEVRYNGEWLANTTMEKSLAAPGDPT